MENLITLNCMNGFTIYIRGSNLVIAAKRTEELIPVSKVQSFSLKEPKGLSSGKITFRTAQAADAGIGLGFGISAAVGAEKTFFFHGVELENAKRVRDFVAGYDTQAVSMHGGEKTVVSVVEEIRGIKALLDDGILTRDEFDAKKKQLLNL